MKVEINTTKNFRREAKPLIKKYPSFLDDLEHLEHELLENPRLGDPLGNNAYKIRLPKEKAKVGAHG